MEKRISVLKNNRCKGGQVWSVEGGDGKEKDEVGKVSWYCRVETLGCCKALWFLGRK